MATEGGPAGIGAGGAAGLTYNATVRTSAQANVRANVQADVQALVSHLGLRPLPAEGTLYAPTYRAADGSSSAMLGLYCQPPAGPLSQSLFHRLPVDEVWHHHGGDALRLVLLHPGGRSETIILGPDWLAGQRPQAVVPADCWQAGHWLPTGDVNSTCGWALFGCTVAPAFHSQMYEGGLRSALLAGWPDCAGDIDRLGCTDAAEARMPPLAQELPGPF